MTWNNPIGNSLTSKHNAFKKYCRRGHEYTQENTSIQKLDNRKPRRVCKKCKTINWMLWYHRKYKGEYIETILLRRRERIRNMHRFLD